MRRIFIIFWLCLVLSTGFGQQEPYQADTWEKVLHQKEGSITVLWYPIEPFIFEQVGGGLAGVEYDIMNSWVKYAERKYGLRIKINWVRAASFVQVYQKIRDSRQAGLFGWSYFSITDRRRKDVQFTSSYLPDLNVLVTHNSSRLYADPGELSKQLPGMQGYTAPGTTMEEDILDLRRSLYPALPVQQVGDDYAIMKRVAADARGIGYVPLSVYILGLQKGYKVKRQQILPRRREGFGGIYTQGSDWDGIIQEYFRSAGYAARNREVLNHYFGPDIAGLIIQISLENTDGLAASANLLSLEKEIVTRKLMDETVRAQRQRLLRNMALLAMALLLTIAGILFNRYRIRERLTEKLAQRNKTIEAQHKVIEHINQRLRLKLLQTRMNPHFLFNSLNAIQYFAMSGDRRATLEYIHRFSTLLRKVVDCADEFHISLEEEMAIARQYLWLEQQRFPDRFDYEVTVAGGLEKNGAQVPPLLTLSLIEETLYRDILEGQVSGKGKIIVHFDRCGDMLSIEVSGNGPNAARSGSYQHDHVLLRRLEIFNEGTDRKISLRRRPAGGNPGEWSSRLLQIPQPLEKLEYG